MAGGGVAVQVDAAGGFEHAAQFDQADRHHRKVGEHVGIAEHLAHGDERLADLLAAFSHLLVGSRGGVVPVPGVFKGLELRGGFGAVVLFEEHVVGGFAVEGRVEVDDVNGLVWDVAAQDVEVVTVIECVHGASLEMEIIILNQVNRLFRESCKTVRGNHPGSLPGTLNHRIL